MQLPKQLVMLGIVNEHIKFEVGQNRNRALGLGRAGAGSPSAAAARVGFPSPHRPRNAPQVFDGAPATVAELAAVEEDLTAGAMQADVVATNQRPLELQLLEASAFALVLPPAASGCFPTAPCCSAPSCAAHAARSACKHRAC